MRHTGNEDVKLLSLRTIHYEIEDIHSAITMFASPTVYVYMMIVLKLSIYIGSKLQRRVHTQSGDPACILGLVYSCVRRKRRLMFRDRNGVMDMMSVGIINLFLLAL